MTAERILYSVFILVACSLLRLSCCVPAPEITLSSSGEPVQGVKCKNEQGKDVDWFIVYKLPKNKTSSNELVREGLAYAYIESDPKPDYSRVKVEDGKVNANVPISETTEETIQRKGPLDGNLGNLKGELEPDWILSEKGIHSPESIVGLSIAQLYEKKNQDIAFLTYNDQPPVGPTVDTGGHSKGIVVTSLASGFWIQHSVPHFPLIPTTSSSSANYTYPSTGKNNGQIFHCISLPSTKDVDDLGRIFEITKPHVVNFSLPTDSFKIVLPQLAAIVRNGRRAFNLERVNSTKKWRPSKAVNPSCLNEVDEKGCLIKQLNLNTTKKNWDQVEIRSGNGRVFTAFAKGPTFNEDIYSSQIAPIYKTSLKVQSWLNGAHPFESNCSWNFYVYNIKDKSIAGHRFSTHNDHSKWALSMKQEQPLICISDLNRMEHQLKRGGVAVCFPDPQLWLTFNKSIIDVQPCPRLPTRSGMVDAPQKEGLAQETSSSFEPSFSIISPVVALPKATAQVDGNKHHKSYQQTRTKHNPTYLRKVTSRAYSFTAHDSIFKQDM